MKIKTQSLLSSLEEPEFSFSFGKPEFSVSWKSEFINKV